VQDDGGGRFENGWQRNGFLSWPYGYLPSSELMCSWESIGFGKRADAYDRFVYKVFQDTSRKHGVDVPGA
jgi:hypothetical protein